MGWGQNNTVQTLETELDIQTMYRQCTASVQKMKVQCTDSVKLVEIQWTDSIQTAYKQCIVNVQTVSGSAWTNSVQKVDIYICAQTVHKMRYWPDGQYIINVQFTDTVQTDDRHCTHSVQTLYGQCTDKRQRQTPNF